MENQDIIDLSRRERQIMDILIRLGKATAEQVRKNIPGAPSYSTIRTLLRILEQKGKVFHKKEKKTLFVFSKSKSRPGKKISTQERAFHLFSRFSCKCRISTA